jgi:hypothetical protein
LTTFFQAFIIANKTSNSQHEFALIVNSASVFLKDQTAISDGVNLQGRLLLLAQDPSALRND